MAVIVLTGALGAAGTVEVPRPELADVEPRVRGKVEAFRLELEADLDDGDAWGRYGIVLDAHRMLRSAAIAYAEARRLDPGEFRWPYFLAAILEYEDPLAASKLFEEALAIDPNYAPARIRAASTLETLGRDDEALTHYRRAAELDPGLPLAPFGLGRIALSRDEVDSAIGHLERAYDLDPGIQAVVATLARACRRAGDLERARELAAQARSLPRMTHRADELLGAVSREAVDTESYLRRAKTYVEVGNVGQAGIELETLVGFEPDLASAHFALAGVYDRLGRADDALTAARTAMRLDPDLQGARAVLAGALMKSGQRTDALREARIVLRDEPENTHMLMIVTLVAAQEGRMDEMLTSLDRAYRSRTAGHPMQAVMLRMLVDVAESFADLGEFAEAARRMDQAVVVARESGVEPVRLRSLEARSAQLRHR